MTILIIDNSRGDKDSYLPKILNLFNVHKIDYIKIDSMIELESLQEPIQAVLLSESPPVTNGGNFYETKETLRLNKAALEKYIDKPIVGICFGCQFINTYFGGTLKKLDKAYCDTSLVSFKNRINIHIQFCLRFVIDKPANNFKILAYSRLHGIKFPSFITHKSKQIYGMLFHPEYLEDTEFILHNLFKSFY